MADPLDEGAVRALEFALDKEVRRRVALPEDIETAYERLYGEGRSAIDRISEAAGEREDEDRDADLERLKDLASEAPVIRLAKALISRAVEMDASDIHLEAGESRLRLRYRSTAYCARSGGRRASRARSSLDRALEILTTLAGDKRSRDVVRARRR
jgi:general secretion pathway protein E